MSMKGSSYRERDYAFGRVMLTLRTRLELTQTELAEHTWRQASRRDRLGGRPQLSQG